MAQLKAEQMGAVEQIVFVMLAISLQLLLYFVPPSFPYPLYVRHPEFGRLFFLAYTITFFGGISSGAVLGWRYLPVVVPCLAATTLVLWTFLGMVALIVNLFTSATLNKFIKDFIDILYNATKEETIPAASWSMIGGISGSFLYMLGKRTGTVESPFRFLFHLTVASIIIIAIIGIAALILRGGPLIFAWGPMVFMGITLGLLAPARAVFLAGISQVLFGAVVVSWLLLTVHGEGGMIIMPLFLMIPIYTGCGILGAVYGTYLRNHFLVEENKNHIGRPAGRFPGGNKQ